MAEVAMAGLQGEPGVLHGYRRWAVQGEEYPAIRSYEHGRVQGML